MVCQKFSGWGSYGGGVSHDSNNTPKATHAADVPRPRWNISLMVFRVVALEALPTFDDILKR